MPRQPRRGRARRDRLPAQPCASRRGLPLPRERSDLRPRAGPDRSPCSERAPEDARATAALPPRVRCPGHAGHLRGGRGHAAARSDRDDVRPPRGRLPARPQRPPRLLRLRDRTGRMTRTDLVLPRSPHRGTNDAVSLDLDLCLRALGARDRRFDGRFFIAVRTTGIYCRPICPARTPKPENVTFFTTPAAAEEAGYRPCRRCRPETAPASPAWQGTSATVTRALRLLGTESRVDRLADRLGVGERHLRRLFAEHL